MLPCVLKSSVCPVEMKCSLFKGGIKTEKPTLVSTITGPFVSP